MKSVRIVDFFFCYMLGLLAWCTPSRAQPVPQDTLAFYLPAGTVASPCYTPVAMSFYPVYDGIPNDSVRRIFGDQLAAGSAETADRVIDTRTGATAYRTGPGQWAGNLTRVLNRRALLVANRHEAVTIILSGVPADSVTYIFPMPAGEFRTAAPRMGASHSIDSVGFVYSSFHASENMRQGGDLVIDMVTRQITRRDLSVGWIGTLDSLRPGHPIIVQVNNVNTFDWTYYPGQP